jgi:hypothetical protein
LRRQAINNLWQMFRELLQKFIARETCAPRQIFDRVPVESLFELVGRYRAILTRAHPRVREITVSGAGEPIQEFVQSARRLTTMPWLGASEPLVVSIGAWTLLPRCK